MDSQDHASAQEVDAPGRRLPGQTVSCGWCQKPTHIPRRGRIPKWCSDTCRHRAWEQKRAAESGRSAVEVVDRPVEVLRTVIQERVVKVPDQNTPRSAREWLYLLDKLDWALQTNRMSHDDLDIIEPKLHRLWTALQARRARLNPPNLKPSEIISASAPLTAAQRTRAPRA